MDAQSHPPLSTIPSKSSLLVLGRLCKVSGKSMEGGNNRTLISGGLVKWRIPKKFPRKFLAAEGVTYCYKLRILGSFVMLGYFGVVYLREVCVKVLLQPLGKKFPWK